MKVTRKKAMLKRLIDHMLAETYNTRERDEELIKILFRFVPLNSLLAIEDAITDCVDASAGEPWRDDMECRADWLGDIASEIVSEIEEDNG
jgi:hypothetical protein